MSNDIERFQGRVERIADEVDLAAGQYWRTRHAVSEREDTYEGHSNTVWGANHRKIGQDGVMAFTARRALPEDMVLLVKSLRVVDGDIHTVVLSAHPEDPDQGEIRFLLDEFFEHMVYAPDGEQVRALAIAAVNDKMRQIQADLVAGPPELAGLPAPKVVVPSIGALVKVVEHQEKINSAAENQLELAQKKQQWIATHSVQISSELKTMSRYLQEQGDAAMASVETTIAQVQTIQKGLRTLGLYTGEGIEVETIAEGEPAPSDERLTIYQQRLFLDEELVAAMATGGIDSEDFQYLEDYIKQDPDFINRVAPSPRSVVLMNLRRTARLPEMVSIDQIFAAITKAREDTQAFLLIRNGENIHLVWSDLVWNYDKKSDDFDAQGLKRLFPTTGDVDQPFRGVNGRNITTASLDYTDARAAFDDRALAYKRMLLMLWGLHDRTNIFGDFYDRRQYEDWTNFEFQENHFKFLADEEFGLMESRLSHDKFIVEKNSYLMPGSRVLVGWGLVVDENTAREFYKYERFNSQYYPKYKPEVRHSVVTAKAKDGHLVVSGRMLSLSKGQPKLAHIKVTGKGRDVSKYGWLCLDAITVAEIDSYINSRRDRQHYMSYMTEFLAARRFLLDEEKTQATAIAELSNALLASGLCEAEMVRPTVLEAIRLWRTQNDSKLIRPRLLDSKAHIAIMNLMYVVLGKEVDAAQLAESICGSQGRAPLRVSVDGNANIVLYSTCVGEELREHLGRHYWVKRMTLDRALPYPHVKDERIIALKSRIASEITIKAFPSIGEWQDLQIPDEITYDELGDILAAIDIGHSKLIRMIEGDGIPTVLQGALTAMAEVKKKGSHTRVSMRAPIGLVLDRKIKILIAEDDPLFVYARASAEAKRQVYLWLDRNYLHPETHIELLGKKTQANGLPNLDCIDMDDWRAWFSKNEDSPRYSTQGIRNFYSTLDWKASLKNSLAYHEKGDDQDWISKVLRYCPADILQVLDTHFGAGPKVDEPPAA